MNYVFYYKIACLFVGLIICYLGYKLFTKGIFGKAGDLESSWKDFKLVITKAAPGVYFVVLGTIIICTTIYKGLSQDDYVNRIPPATEVKDLPDTLLLHANDSLHLRRKDNEK